MAINSENWELKSKINYCNKSKNSDPKTPSCRGKEMGKTTDSFFKSVYLLKTNDY